MKRQCPECKAQVDLEKNITWEGPKGDLPVILHKTKMPHYWECPVLVKELKLVFPWWKIKRKVKK